MTIIEVKTSAHIKTFHQIPFEIYKNDSNWIPHIKQDVEKVFTKKENKFLDVPVRNICKLNDSTKPNKILLLRSSKWEHTSSNNKIGFLFSISIRYFDCDKYANKIRVFCCPVES